LAGRAPGFAVMKKVLLALILSVSFGANVVVLEPAVVFAQGKDDKKRKDPPGPPVVKDKRNEPKPKEPPPKRKKPD